MLRLYTGSEESVLWGSDGAIYSIGRSVMDQCVLCVCVHTHFNVCIHVFASENKCVKVSIIVFFVWTVIVQNLQFSRM